MINMYGLLCIFFPRYSNKDDFISMGEAQTGSEGPNGTGGGQMVPWLSLEPPLCVRNLCLLFVGAIAVLW